MDDTLTKILLDILLVVVTAGIGLVSMYLRKRWGIEQTQKIYEAVRQAVNAAELIGASLGFDGAAKKQWVVDKISSTFKIDAEQLNIFIEAAVAALKAEGSELVKLSNKSGDRIVLASTANTKSK
jgi:hypothetical protein